MKKPKFPTQKQFEAWWRGKRDGRYRTVECRAGSCPIARYLRGHGFPKALVRSEVWETGHGSFQPLPRWARNFIHAADNKFWGIHE